MKIETEIAEATGKLGILTPGMGAVATTFVAGVYAVRKGDGKPIGSLTQMGTIRLGKRTEKRVPLIKDFVSLSGLDDLVFGGWDIFLKRNHGFLIEDEKEPNFSLLLSLFLEEHDLVFYRGVQINLRDRICHESPLLLQF